MSFSSHKYITFYFLVLAISALLLCRVGESAETPGPQQEQRSSGENKPPKSDTRPENLPAPTIQQGTPKTPDRYSYQIENYNYNSEKSWNWPSILQAISA